MKKDKKSHTKWQITEQKPQKQSNTSLQSYRLYDRCESSNYIFSLPKPVLEEPHTIIAKRARHALARQQSDISGLVMDEKYYNNKSIRNTLIDKTKQIFWPMKKQSSFNDVNRKSLEKQLSTIHQRRASIIKQNSSSKKTLQILQKIILHDVDFYAREISVFEVQANKLPIIQCKQSRRKILAPYEARFNPPHSSISKFQTIPVKQLKPIAKKQKPYFSGWQAHQC